ncbi:MAG TPA: hypothetical protein VF852_09830, partial [Pseudolabrys sp.]
RLKSFDACYLEVDLRQLLQGLQNFGQVGSLFNRGLSLHSIQLCASSRAHAPRAAQHLAFFILTYYLARLLLQGRRPISVATWRRDKSDGKTAANAIPAIGRSPQPNKVTRIGCMLHPAMA